MKKFLFLLVIAPSALVAQQAASHSLAVKSTPAEDTLLSLAKQSSSALAAYNAILEQERKQLAAENKPIEDEIRARSAKWQAKIDSDTKDLRAKIDANTKAAEDDFNNKIKPLQSQLVSAQTINTLIEVVKKEQNLPADAVFNIQTQQWTEPGNSQNEKKEK